MALWSAFSLLLFFASANLLLSLHVNVSLVSRKIFVEVSANKCEGCHHNREQGYFCHHAHVLNVNECNRYFTHSAAQFHFWLTLQLVRVLLNIIAHKDLLLSHGDGSASFAFDWVFTSLTIGELFPIDVDQLLVACFLVVEVIRVILVLLELVDHRLVDTRVAVYHHLGQDFTQQPLLILRRMVVEKFLNHLLLTAVESAG